MGLNAETQILIPQTQEHDMPHTRRTLSLDKKWDITLTGSGKISVTNGDMATAQSVANEGRLFTEDAYFIQDRGTPHFVVELGKKINDSVLRSYLRKAALRVPDVLEIISIDILDFNIDSRVLSGDIVFRTVEGEAKTQIHTYF